MGGFGLPGSYDRSTTPCTVASLSRVVASWAGLNHRSSAMFKVTPNPPETENVSPYESLDSTKLHKAAERALDHHPASPLDTSRLADARPVNIFAVVPGLHTETLLANASETLASVNAMASDLAFELEGSRRSVALAIQQMAELGQLLVDKALDQVA